MTNAIETTKREMYSKLSAFRNHAVTLETLEESIEQHLEQLRQQYEQMAATARDRFESIQSLEQSGQDLTAKLSAMTEERDAIRNKLQAFEFANKSSGEFLIDALRKVKSQRKTIKALRKAQEARESVGATSVSSEGEFGHNMTLESSKQHSSLSHQDIESMLQVMEHSKAVLGGRKDSK